MNIVFVSNYFNHHQRPLSEKLYELTGGNYTFIETEPMEAERKNMGWGESDVPAFVVQNYIDEEARNRCDEMIYDADVVIYGAAPYEILADRLKAKKLTFAYFERIYKKKCKGYKIPPKLFTHYLQYSRHKSLYLLCASAYTLADFAKTRCFLDKAYKWGYFPKTKSYQSLDELIESKKKNSIVWVARFIDWKHPEIPILLAKRLIDDGYDFELNMIGNGEMLDAMRAFADENQVSDKLSILGSMSPDEVRNYMEKSELLLFTSDRNEGWGAVLNEAMNSACVPVASHIIGSAPYLMDNGKNGFLYRDGDFEDMYQKIKYLLENNAKRQEMARSACRTVVEDWNADVAAKRIIELAGEILDGNRTPALYSDGICSKAEILKDNWL